MNVVTQLLGFLKIDLSQSMCARMNRFQNGREMEKSWAEIALEAWIAEMDKPELHEYAIMFRRDQEVRVILKAMTEEDAEKLARHRLKKVDETGISDMAVTITHGELKSPEHPFVARARFIPPQTRCPKPSCRDPWKASPLLVHDKESNLWICPSCGWYDR